MKKPALRFITAIMLIFAFSTMVYAKDVLKSTAADVEKGWQKLAVPLLEKAIKALDDMAKKNPKDHLALYYSARAHFAIADCLDIKSSEKFDQTGEGENHIDTALDLIKTSLSIKEDSADTHILRYKILRRKMSHVGFPQLMMLISDRKKAHTRSKELSPDCLDVQIINALEVAEGGWPMPPPEEPVAEFEKILKKSPNTPDAYYYIGTLWDKAKKTADAEKNYKKALELNPNHHWAKKMLKSLSSGSGA
jgi:tetratricopeptide (TPR) repeat protein